MKTNSRNFGSAIGYLGRDPKIFQNRDGSQKVMMTLAVRQNRKNADGKYGTDWLDLEDFIPAGASLGAYPLLHKGLKLQVLYTVETRNYTDATGNRQHKQALRVTDLQFLDAKGPDTATSARAGIGAEENLPF